MINDLNFWLSVVTAIVAIIAISQTSKQIKLSNKQHLFDKRIDNYLIAIGLIELYRNNSSVLQNEEEPIFANELYFIWLTNNTYLEKITSVINKTNQQEKHKEFLYKMEELKVVATKIKLMFSGKEAIILGEFVLRYQELLFEMYKYQIVLNKVNENSNTITENDLKNVNENKHRIKLQSIFDNLKECDNMLKNENVEEKIKKQIKLK